MLEIPCRMRKVFRSVFERTVPFEPDEDEVSFWQIVVSNVATIVLFPYVRARSRRSSPRRVSHHLISS